MARMLPGVHVESPSTPWSRRVLLLCVLQFGSGKTEDAVGSIASSRENQRAASVFVAQSLSQWIGKRVFDVAFSLLALLFVSPILLLIAILIKLDSPGPVIYVSQRVGRNGIYFSFYKFRTMVQDADSMRSALAHLNKRSSAALFKIADDPRRTQIGRFLRRYSLDEVPQFWNVLLGDMSLVGPRPCLPSEYRNYTAEQRRRLEITPGITGLWQVESRTDPSVEAYFAKDLYYVENWGFELDMKILLRTVVVVLSGNGE